MVHVSPAAVSPSDCHLQVGEGGAGGSQGGVGQEGPTACSAFCPLLAPQAAIMSASGDGTRGSPKSKGKVREQRATLSGTLGR